MKRILTLTVLLLLSGSSCLPAQLWEPFDGKGCSLEVRGFYADTVSNLLYVVGAFKYAGDSLVNGVAAWDGEKWRGFGGGTGDTLNPAWSPPILSVVPRDGELIVGGFMPFMALDYGIANLARWDGQQWNACGQPQSPIWLREVGTELFALGWFTEISGKNINNIAVWNGQEWDGFGHPTPLVGSNAVVCVEKYRGEYYFGGNFHDPPGYDLVMRWDGNEWSDVGGGIPGGWVLNDLKAYRGQLFAGGDFLASTGNASNRLMAWNGQNWYNPFPGVVFIDQVQDLDIIEGELYIVGNHVIWDGGQWVGPYNLARYDGVDFCSFGGKYVWANQIVGYQGDIIVASGKILNAMGDDSEFPNGRDTVNFLARWLGGDSTDHCAYYPVSAAEPVIPEKGITVYPNPASESFRLALPDAVAKCNFRILDIAGREVAGWRTYRGGEINLNGLQHGVYIVEAIYNKATLRIKLVVEK